MNIIIKFIAAVSLCMLATHFAIADDNHPRVLLETSQGDILLELDRKAAPLSVKNFIEYVEAGEYDNTIFHRVMDGFMVQGGGFTPEFRKTPTRASIKNEANNGLKNVTGTVAMARTSAPHSATNQFFINVADNRFLNHTAPNHQGWGYAVFGKVIEGMLSVDKIRQLPTGRGGPFPENVPQPAVIILKATLVVENSPQ